MARLYLHSFPTRRSSDLVSLLRGRQAQETPGARCDGCQGSKREPPAPLVQDLGRGGRARVHLRDDVEKNRRHLEEDRKSTRLNSSHSQISYAVFCLKKKT